MHRPIPSLRLLGIAAWFLLSVAPTTVARTRVGASTRGPVTSLLQRWGDDPSMTEADLRRAITDQGPSALGEILEVLARGRYTAPPVEGRAAVYELDPLQHEAMLGAVLDLPRSGVEHHLHGLATRPAPLGERRVALEILAEWGRPEDVSLALALAREATSTVTIERGLRESLVASLQRLVEREPAALARLRRLAPELELDPLLCVIRVLGTSGEREDIAGLAWLLQRRPQIGNVALSELGRLAARHTPPFDAAARQAVRERLLSTGGPSLVQALETVVLLDDVDAVPLLLDLLDSDYSSIRREAHRALVAICRESLRLDGPAWRRWYASQRGWWTNQAPECFAGLSSGSPESEARAIHELASRELFRHEIAIKLGQYMLSAQHDRASLACAALAHLRSGAAVPHLTAALERPEPLVQQSANEALRTIRSASPASHSRSTP